MTTATLLSHLEVQPTMEARLQFRSEQRCTVAFAGLPVVRRVFTK